MRILNMILQPKAAVGGKTSDTSSSERPDATVSGNSDDNIASNTTRHKSTTKQNVSIQNNSKIESKSQRQATPNSFGQQVKHSNHQNHNLHETTDINSSNFHAYQRNSQQLNRSALNNLLYQQSQSHSQTQTPTQSQPKNVYRSPALKPFGRQLTRSSFPEDVTMALNLNQEITKAQHQAETKRWVSPSTSRENFDADNLKFELDEHERNSEQVVVDSEKLKLQSKNGENQATMIDNSLDKTDLDTLGSLERELPVELSFLIRQQAYCLARINYLERQIRELKSEAKHQNQQQLTNIMANASASSSPPFHHYTPHIPNQNSATNQFSQRLAASSTTNIGNNIAGINHKNGNFIPSDDSGGEYSRATISDEDELSSLLDQIAKSLRPEARGNHLPSQITPGSNNMAGSNHLFSQSSHLHHQSPQRANFGALNHFACHQPAQHQPYTFISNAGHLNSHHPQQAVPVLVAMSSPIALAHHHPASGISSSILPGVHFQPEIRYNQYYEDSFVHNNMSSSSSTTMLNHPINRPYSGLNKMQQFDNSISALEHLVSQKEKRQIKSQLKSADNWLKMQATGLSNPRTDDLNNAGSAAVTADCDNEIDTGAPTVLSSGTMPTSSTTKNRNSGDIYNNVT